MYIYMYTTLSKHLFLTVSPSGCVCRCVWYGGDVAAYAGYLVGGVHHRGAPALRHESQAAGL